MLDEEDYGEVQSLVSILTNQLLKPGNKKTMLQEKHGVQAPQQTQQESQPSIILHPSSWMHMVTAPLTPKK
jgi:hypothetical protein